MPPMRGDHQVEVPWSRPGSGFTLLFEAMIVAMAREMPVNALAKMVGEHDTRLWRIIRHHTAEAVERQDLSEVRRVGVDETASRRWHHYITLFLDLERVRMIFGTSGRDRGTVAAFAGHLARHGGNPEVIAEVTCEMSPAYIHGTQEYLPNARITLDRFHIMKLANDAVDEVRRDEVKTNPLLKKTR
ncbi:transposase [Limnochorda pilosa]|uniref:Transposase n=1 Tax=Limnochorda pilosa TaxID=1555112 RepID=A0A0K2SH29_LIMPI|nr:transposase [Limnochorda pilosa]